MRSHFQKAAGVKWLVIGSLLANLASVASAVDGVVLINQASALAGSVTPGDAPGFPVTISQPGSYRLAGNLLGGGITVSASNVRIDLNGFVVSGGITSAGVGGNVTIVNGSITGGIYITGSDTWIENVFIGPNPQSNAIESAGTGKKRIVIKNSNLSGNQYGIVLFAVDCLIEGNLITGNRNGGIFLSNLPADNSMSMASCTIMNNTISQNGNQGIRASYYRDEGVLYARNNVINANTGLGLAFEFGDSVAYGGNVFMGNNGGNSFPQVGELPGGSHKGIQIGPNVCGSNPACP